DPDAVSDLAIYRSQYGLAACDTTTGAGCVIKENEEGQASPLPGVEPSSGTEWAATESADLDMVSAICPNCRILLIEANSASITDLGTAENTAASGGAAFVTNSWNSGEFSTEDYYDNAYFNHPGVAITVASGELGYGTTWPTTSQYVTAVGGTSLTQATGVTRGWTESVWNDGNGHATGSGCSMAEPKPAWQTLDDTSAGGCLNRTENDVAAVADPQTGVAMYDTYGKQYTGWSVAGGTSVAAPIIASVYALAGPPTAGTYPASYPYQSGHAADLYDVTTGSNGTCEASRQYLCNGETGYDGPTGLGTPDGTAAFRNSVTGNVVTLTDPGGQDEEAGTPVFVAVAGSDSAGLALTYSATHLPPGLSMGTASGHITGTLSSTTHTYKVTVTAKDSTGATGSVKFSIVVMKSLATDFDGVSGPVDLDMDNKCLDDYHNISTQGAVVDEWTCNGTGAQNWEYEPGGKPGGPGVVVINKKCLDLKGGATAPYTPTVLDTCDGASTQEWQITGADGDLYNYAAGLCLADPGGDTKNGRQLWVWNCDGGVNQAWIPPASPVQSGVTGMCVDDNHDITTNGNKVQVWDCNNTGAQRWTSEPDETLRLGGKCLTVTGSSMLDGATVVLDTCGTTTNQQWVISGSGELINVNSGRCLADPGKSTTEGTALVQEDCYGLSGEIWAVT
ncbi:MAG: ricin-type beta-trefoil lectin domain protein, partial [Streptosporangiaceae bacterium]